MADVAINASAVSRLFPLKLLARSRLLERHGAETLRCPGASSGELHFVWEAMMSKQGLLEKLESGVVLAAEGYVFELERRGYVQAGPYVPDVVLDHPEAVLQLHREFQRAGSDVVLALTY
jgi:hypothetical protein